MTCIERSSALVVATVFGLAIVGGCDAGTGSHGGDGGVDGAGDAGPDGGLPPGTSCVVDLDAGNMVSTFCLDNPVLPTCHQCVDLTDDGELNGVCAYTCRMDEADCPPGQTCTAAGTTHRTGYQDCRDLTDGHELGYCR